MNLSSVCVGSWPGANSVLRVGLGTKLVPLLTNLAAKLEVFKSEIATALQHCEVQRQDSLWIPTDQSVRFLINEFSELLANWIPLRICIHSKTHPTLP